MKILKNTENFNLTDIFECGQCFRFKKTENGGYEGAAYGKYLRVYQENDKICFDTTAEDFDNVWYDYFDLGRDYKQIYNLLRRDEVLKKASDFCPGLRILKQEPFECLISYIISQNNNIPRIKKIIERLCGFFGEKINDEIYAFPSAEKLAGLTVSDLGVIKSGFRAKYILDAAKKIHSGEIDLDLIYGLNTADGAAYLKKINGVGDKVSGCVMLFGYNKLDAFPVDVWIKKVLEKYYPDYPANCDFGDYSGVANAYLFYYERNNKLKVKDI